MWATVVPARHRRCGHGCQRRSKCKCKCTKPAAALQAHHVWGKEWSVVTPPGRSRSALVHSRPAARVCTCARVNSNGGIGY